MKHALFALLWLAAAAPAAAVEDVFPYQTHVETLDNGLKVIIVPMSGTGLVSYHSIVRTGSRDEYEPGHTGFAHFFEHMMFRGTKKYPADRYNKILTELGADSNAYTTDDFTNFYLVVASADLERVMEIESDRFENLSYPEPDFKTEAGAVYGEYRKNRSSPFFSIWEALHETAFDKHTYGHTTMGYEKDIKAMPTMYDYSRSFFDRYYRPRNVVLLIVGDVDVPQTMALVKQYYGGWKEGYVKPKVPAEPPQTAERRIDVPYEGQSLPILWLAYKLPEFSPDSRAFAATQILAELAFGETSDLYKDLVLDEQLVEFLQAEAEPHRDPYLFHVITRIKDKDKVGSVLASIDDTVAHYQNELPDHDRLDAVKSRLRYGFLMRLDTPDNVAQNLSRFIAVTGGTEGINQMFTTYDEVTAEDVRSAAQQFLEPNRRTVAVLRAEE